MLVDEVRSRYELMEITPRKSGCRPNVIYSAIEAYSIDSFRLALKLDLCSNIATTVSTDQILFWEQSFFI